MAGSERYKENRARFLQRFSHAATSEGREVIVASTDYRIGNVLAIVNDRELSA